MPLEGHTAQRTWVSAPRSRIALQAEGPALSCRENMVPSLDSGASHRPRAAGILAAGTGLLVAVVSMFAYSVGTGAAAGLPESELRLVTVSAPSHPDGG